MALAFEAENSMALAFLSGVHRRRRRRPRDMTWSGRIAAEGGAVCFWVARPVVAEGGQRHGCFERTLEAALGGGFLVMRPSYD